MCCVQKGIHCRSPARYSNFNISNLKKDKKGASEMYKEDFAPLKPVMLEYFLHYMDQDRQVNF